MSVERRLEEFDYVVEELIGDLRRIREETLDVCCYLRQVMREVKRIREKRAKRVRPKANSGPFFASQSLPTKLDGVGERK